MKIKFKTNEYLNVTARVEAVGVPFPNEDQKYAGKHIKFRATISNPMSGRKMGVTWYDSEANYMKNIQELDEDMARSILSSVSLDASSYECATDFSDFCHEFGYSDDSIRALKVYKACKSESERWSRVTNGLSEETLEEIRNY